MSLINAALKSPKRAHLLCWNAVEYGDAERCRKMDLDTGFYWLWSLGSFFPPSIKWENRVVLGIQGDDVFMGRAQSLERSGSQSICHSSGA